ncbi:MAG: YitT family protein [Subdoligranulum sp.]|nr:YitT family protein [Subdoligranulum sp.]
MKNQHKKLACGATLLAGAAILSFGLFNVHSQSGVTEGGVLGTTLLLHHWFGISPGISEFVIDAVCYTLGCRYLGKGFLRRALAASAAFAVFYLFWERTGYLLPNLSAHPLAAALLGGVFVGAGVGLVVRAGGASGGDDVLALLLEKFTRLTLSKAYFFTDAVVLALSLSYIPLRRIAFSFLTVTLSSFLIERVRYFGRPKPQPKSVEQ